jgi:predicted Zn finger-like uncharacterized protein
VSLATRCASCATVFRVVQDQLKVSEGMVRCGRCGEVFDALEGLFDLEGSSGPMPLPRGKAAAPVSTLHDEEPVAEGADDDGPAVDEQAQDDERDDALGEPGELRSGTPSSSPAASDFGSSRPASVYDLEMLDSVMPDDSVAAAPPQDIAPSFVRHVARADQWRRPRVRRSLWLAGTLLGLMLGAQLVVHERAQLAARWPDAAPMLTSLCGLFGFTIEAPRTLETLAVESSGLTRIDNAALYRLQVTLRNRGASFALTPALDLTLTDLRGDIVARRILRAGDFAPPGPAQLGVGGDWPINAVLDLGDARVAGYTVEIFYP